jgi:hypothetical protein
VETGDIGPSDKFVKACDKAFPGRHGWFTRFWLRLPRAASRAYKPWFHGWVEEFERQAVILREWEPEPIPRQLQTRDYAHAILGSWRRHGGDTVEENVSARIDRQRIMDRSDPPDLRVLLDESVLSLEVGSATVMHAQVIDYVGPVGAGAAGGQRHESRGLLHAAGLMPPCSPTGSSRASGPAAQFG